MKRAEKSVLRENIEGALVAVVIALIVRTFVMAAYKIPTGSMIPTLKIGDFIFSWKLPYAMKIPFSNFNLITPRMPNHGDVIVFKSLEDPATSLIKRVIALPGDRIEIKKRILILNGKTSHYDALATDAVTGDSYRDYYQIYREEVMGQTHDVMFRRGQEEESFGPEVVPEGKIFVLGDNRDSSEDSRNWGMVPIENVEGRAFMIWLSLDWDHRHHSTGLPRIRNERLFSKVN